MPGDRNDAEIRRGLHCIKTINDPFGIGLGIRIRAMDDSLRAEVLGVARRIADVVLVREEDVRDPAHSLEGVNQLFHIPGRIDEPIAIKMADEIAVRAERLLRVEPVVEDIVFNHHGEAFSGGTHHSLIEYQSADRAESRSEEHTSELQSLAYLVCRLLLEKKK